jgi:hypothetical protein
MGTTRPTLFGWMLPSRDAVLAGDRARVEQLLATGYYQDIFEVYDPDWRAIMNEHSRERDSSWLNDHERHYRQYLASRDS